MREQVDFQYFTGKVGLLSGVWTGHEQVKEYDWSEETVTANVMYFMWDGVIYMGAEDPSDGYRSSLRYIQRCPTLFPVNVWDPSERCSVRYVGERETYPGGEDWKEKTDILEFVSEVTGKVVMTLGTSNTDDYYPSCVLYFDPRALSHNQPEIDLLGRN